MQVEASRGGDQAPDPALLPRWAVLGSMTLLGRSKHVRDARTFVARTIGDHPRADAAMLLTSEIVTNAVVHSRSQLPGGTVAVLVALDAASLLVTVTDDGSDSIPVVRNSPGAGSGNGLLLVDQLADHWGYLRGGSRTTVWFRLCSAGHEPADSECGLPHEREPPSRRLDARPGSPGAGEQEVA